MDLIVFPVRGGNGDGGVGRGVRLFLQRRWMGPPHWRVEESGARGGAVREFSVMVPGAPKNMKNEST